MKQYWGVLWIWMLFAGAGPVWATPYDDGISPAELQQLVQTAMVGLGHPQPNDIPATRHFPRCDDTPDVSLFHDQIDKVEITCDSPRLWKRVVKTGLQPRVAPTSIQPTAQISQNQVVLAKSLRAGAVIKISDVEVISVTTDTIALGFDSLDQVIGRRMQVPLGQGRMLQSRHLEQDWAVTPDQPVQIGYAVGGIEIVAPGRAQDQGQVGDLIWVENTATGRRLRGVVASKNKILVQAKIK